MCPPSYDFPPPHVDTCCFFPAQDTTEKVEDQRAVLANKQDLERDLSELLTQIRSGLLDPVGLEKAVLTAQQHCAALDPFLSKTIDTKFYNERRQDTSTAAQQTFDVVELLEMILEHLEIPDILRMSQVSHSIHNSIEHSAKLQTKLSLRPTPTDSHLYTPFLWCLSGTQGGFSCYIEPIIPPRLRFAHTTRLGRSTPDDDATIMVRAQFSPTIGQHLPKIGATYRRMFCCQPPIKKMYFDLNCCRTGFSGEFASKNEACTVIAEEGLTIGHLYDCAKKLMEEHRLCPHAHSEFYLEDDGTVKTGVYFQGFLNLLEDDPILQDRKARDEANEVWLRQNDARTAKLMAYGAAKMQAHENGETIPTLHEFEARNVGTDWLEVMGTATWPGANFGQLPPPPPPMTNATFQGQFTIQPMPPILPPTTSNNVSLNSSVITSTGENHVTNSAETDDQSISNDAMGSENAVGSSLDLVGDEV